MRWISLLFLFTCLEALPANFGSVMPGDDLATVNDSYGPLADLSNLEREEISHPPERGITQKEDGLQSVIDRKNTDLGMDAYQTELQVNLYNDIVINKQYSVRLGTVGVEQGKEAFEAYKNIMRDSFGEEMIKGGTAIPDFGDDVSNTLVWERDHRFAQLRFDYDPFFGAQALLVVETVDCPEEARCKLDNNILVKFRQAEASDEEPGEEAGEAPEDSDDEAAKDASSDSGS